jgi:hypothetical protein
MQVKSPFTGLASLADIQIQNSISHLLIIKSGTAEIVNEQITLVIKTGTGKSVPIIPLTKIRRPAVISQFGQGYQLIQQMGAGVVKCAFLISLSDYGAITLENADYLSLDLGLLDTTATYTVYGIESPNKVRAYTEYNSQVITGAEPQNKAYTPDDDCKGIALSNNGALSSIRLSFTNGNEVTYLPEELNAIMRNGNDIAFAADLMIEGDILNQTMSGGGAELWWIPLQDCYAFSISTVGGVDLSVIQLIRKGF